MFFPPWSRGGSECGADFRKGSQEGKDGADAYTHLHSCVLMLRGALGLRHGSWVWATVSAPQSHPLNPSLCLELLTGTKAEIHLGH